MSLNIKPQKHEFYCGTRGLFQDGDTNTTSEPAVVSSEEAPFRTSVPVTSTSDSGFTEGDRCGQMPFLSKTHWGAGGLICCSCAHSALFLPMNPFLLSNLFWLSGDLTFLNYTQSPCVTAFISVCLPSVLPFQMQTCVTVYPLCVTSLLQQIQSSGNQVKVKFISGAFVPLLFRVCHMLIIWIVNEDQNNK